MKALRASICVAVTALALSLSFGAPSCAEEGEASTLTQQMKELYRAGKYKEALPLAQKSLALREKEFGPDDANVAMPLNDLGTIHYNLGQFGVAELTGFGLDGHAQALCASGAVVHYLRENSAHGNDAPKVDALRHLDRVRYYEQHDALILDPVSVRNLEIVAPIFTEEAGKSGPTTFIAAMDVTVTGMGARLLRAWILRPLIDHDAIVASRNDQPLKAAPSVQRQIQLELRHAADKACKLRRREQRPVQSRR